MAFPLPSIPFDKLITLEHVALHLQCSPKDILDVIENSSDHYTTKSVRRRRGASRGRTVHCADDLVRRMHRRLAVALRDAVAALPAYVHGFRPNHSILTHASAHCGKPAVVTVDLADFFSNIGTATVTAAHEKLGCPRQSALLLARLSTVDGVLPQGGRVSPALSNLCVTQMDVALEDFAQARDLAYGRYADDLAFSGDTGPTESDLRALVRPFGFALREGSYRYQSQKAGQFVTGLSVSGAQPRIPRRVRRDLEEAIRFGKR